MPLSCTCLRCEHTVLGNAFLSQLVFTKHAIHRVSFLPNMGFFACNESLEGTYLGPLQGFALRQGRFGEVLVVYGLIHTDNGHGKVTYSLKALFCF